MLNRRVTTRNPCQRGSGYSPSRGRALLKGSGGTPLQKLPAVYSQAFPWAHSPEIPEVDARGAPGT
jgi:hypothetical protein